MQAITVSGFIDILVTAKPRTRGTQNDIGEAIQLRRWLRSTRPV